MFVDVLGSGCFRAFSLGNFASAVTGSLAAPAASPAARRASPRLAVLLGDRRSPPARVAGTDGSTALESAVRGKDGE